MKVSNALFGIVFTSALSLAGGAQVVAAELTPDPQENASRGNHPAVIVAKRTLGFDHSAQQYRHPAGGDSIAPNPSTSFANGYVHVADGVSATEAQAMLQVVARYTAANASINIAKAVPQVSVRVRASYVIEDKVINEIQLLGRFDGQYQGISGHGGLVSESRMEIYQIADGKVIENWSAVGAPSIQQQLAWAIAGTTQLAE